MSKIQIKDVRIEESLYPRTGRSTKAILDYAENIDKLPPIVINKNNLLIDGYHRIGAHKEKGLEEIEYEIEDIPDDQVLWRAIELNARHGVQLSMKDKKRIALMLFDGHNGKRICDALSVGSSTFNNWVKDIRVKKEREVEKRILQLYLKAENTIEDISEEMHMPISTVHDIIQRFPKKINLVISENYNIPSDLGAFRTEHNELTEFRSIKGNVWEISEIMESDKLEEEWGFEQIERENNDSHQWDDENKTKYSFQVNPQQIYEHLLHYYTNIYDIVFAPNDNIDLIRMCEKWYRRYTTGLKKANFIFLQYDDDFYKLVKQSKKQKGAKIAVLHPSDVWINQNELSIILEDRIVVTYPLEMYNDSQQKQSSENKKLLNLHQIISIFKIKAMSSF